MPDTGAPWNIPYVEAADLVSDWPSDSLALANAIDAGLDNAAVIRQVVQTAKTDTFTSTSTSFVTVTGLTASITPATATNKVLVIAQIAWGLNVAATPTGQFKVTRGGTDIYIGDAASSRTQAVFGGYMGSGLRELLMSSSIVFLDSPATTSSTTYQVEAKVGTAGTLYVNRSAFDDNNANYVRGASSITVIEVAA